MRRRLGRLVQASCLLFMSSHAACVDTPPTAAVQPASAGAPATVELLARPPMAAGAVASTPLFNRVDADGIWAELSAEPFLAEQVWGRSLVMMDWEIPGGCELFLCARVTVPSDVYIRGFQPLSPVGTHHTALTIREAPNARDGVTLCDVSEVGPSSIFGSGVGTRSKPLPDGLGVKIAAGSQIIFNLHLLNTDQTPLRGRSGTLAEITTADAIRELADGVAVGPLKLSVPPGHSVQGGVCTVDRDYSIYGLMPHMHYTGVHMRVVARPAGAEPIVIHEGPYDFDNQVAHSFAPIALHKGDTIMVECTFDNPHARTLHFGESSHDEMCIAAVARFPAGGKAACPF